MRNVECGIGNEWAREAGWEFHSNEGGAHLRGLWRRGKTRRKLGAGGSSEFEVLSAESTAAPSSEF